MTAFIMNSTPEKKRQQASELALEQWQINNTDCIIEDESLKSLARETVIVSKEVQPNLEVQVKGQEPLDKVNLGTKDEPKPTYECLAGSNYQVLNYRSLERIQRLLCMELQ